jgi:hypothetical protein
MFVELEICSDDTKIGVRAESILYFRERYNELYGNHVEVTLVDGALVKVKQTVGNIVEQTRKIQTGKY